MKKGSFMCKGMLVQESNLRQYMARNACENQCLLISSLTCVSFLGFTFCLPYRIVDLGYCYMHFWLKWFKLCIQAICAENLSALNLPVTLRQINVIKICISDKSPCGLENRSWSSELLWFMPLINWYTYLCKFGGSPHNGPIVLCLQDSDTF